MPHLIPQEIIESRILFIRGQRMMLDADLAAVYGVTTKRLNEQVKRNRDRFPPDFILWQFERSELLPGILGCKSLCSNSPSMFQLTEAEKAGLVANCDHLKRLKFSPVLPYAFTEHGAIMLASVLNSPLAVQASIQVVRAFVRLRQILSTHKELARKLEALEKRYDAQFRVVFDAIRQLMEPPEEPPRPRIGFHRT